MALHGNQSAELHIQRKFGIRFGYECLWTLVDGMDPVQWPKEMIKAIDRARSGVVRNFSGK